MTRIPDKLIPEGWEQCPAITGQAKRCRKLIQTGWEFCGSHRALRSFEGTPHL